MIGSRLRRVTIWHVAAVSPIVAVAATFVTPFNDNSYLWHVTAGRIQNDAGAVLTSDPLSFTALGEAWRTQSWLADILYAWLDGAVGLVSTNWIVLLSLGLTFLLLGLLAVRSTGGHMPSVTVFLVLTAMAVGGFAVPRPVALSYVLFAAVVVACADRRLTWTLPLLIYVWASVHGSFAIGIAFIGLDMLRRRVLHKNIATVAAIGIASLATAHGWALVEILLQFGASSDALSIMTEWRTPELLSLQGLPILVGLFLCIHMAVKGDFRPGDWWLLVPFVVLGLTANRAIPPAWIGLTPILARAQLPVPTTVKPSPVFGGVAVAMIGVAVALAFGRPTPNPELFPIEALAALDSGAAFHDDVTGGWIAYDEYPDRLVYIDDRAELFGERIRRFAEIRNGVGDWEEEFSRYGIDQALMPAITPIATILAEAGWQEVFEDETFVVLRRP